MRRLMQTTIALPRMASPRRSKWAMRSAAMSAMRAVFAASRVRAVRAFATATRYTKDHEYVKVAGAAGTVGFVNTRIGLRAGIFVQYMPSMALPLQEEFPKAVLTDVSAMKRAA
jgi:hypothetical protein